MARGGRGGAGSGGNAIFGTSGNDILDGRGLSYLLIGGKGDDTYYVDDADDIIDEKNKGGTDRVFSLIDYVLGDHLENLTLMGPNARSGTGNDSDNVLTGNGENNTLLGLGGDDTIYGGGGSDFIDGGDGTDTAVFDGPSTDYTFRWVGSDLHVTSATLATTDVLRNIELLSFSNGLIQVSSIGGGPSDPSAPKAVNDAKLTTEDTSSVVAVLLNDLGTGIAVASVTNGAKGLVNINPDGTVSYTPNANAFGSDTFTYTIRDSLGRESTATVTIQIDGVNDAPLARNDSYTAKAGSTYTSTTSVLANDSDIDGDPLAVIGAGSDGNLKIAPGASSYQTASQAGGAVTINANGTFTYTPASGFSGTDSFTYAVGDGQGGQATATVLINVADSDPGTVVAPPYAIEGLIPSETARLNYPDPYGTSATVTFAFAQQTPYYYWSGSFAWNEFRAFNEQQQEATRLALSAISDMVGIEFVEAPVDQAEMVFGIAQLGGASRGTAYFPTGDGSGLYDSDVWIDADVAGNAFIPGTLDYATLIHEIGHAIGLDHPDTTLIPMTEVSRQYTIMAYGNHPSAETQPETMMLYDIAALQYLYGANMTATAGDDVYDFARLGGSTMAIWDAGGHDTFDLSAATHGIELDMRQGTFSSVSGAGARNIAIAFGAVIEDAQGSAFDDIIIGNDAANAVFGGGGSDVLTGGGGRDVFGFGLSTGADVITDFRRGEDKILLTGGESSINDVSMAVDTGGLEVTHVGGTIYLDGVFQLAEADFVFLMA